MLRSANPRDNVDENLYSPVNEGGSKDFTYDNQPLISQSVTYYLLPQINSALASSITMGSPVAQY